MAEREIKTWPRPDAALLPDHDARCSACGLYHITFGDDHCRCSTDALAISESVGRALRSLVA